MKFPNLNVKVSPLALATILTYLPKLHSRPQVKGTSRSGVHGAKQTHKVYAIY